MILMVDLSECHELHHPLRIRNSIRNVSNLKSRFSVPASLSFMHFCCLRLAALEDGPFIDALTLFVYYIWPITPFFNIIYIEMVNYNMGRYYAWQNLSKLIKNTIRKRFHTSSYNFIYIPPKIHTSIHLIPFEEWKANKNYARSQFKYAIAGIAFVAYLASKFIYQVLEDDDQGYFYHLTYPVVSQSIVWIHADLAELTNPFFDIMPRDRYQVAQIYPRLYDLIFKPQKKIEEQDRKAIQLRQAMEEYDNRHK